MEEIETIAENLQPGDRVHFFWTEFPDGNIINGGNDILEVNLKVPKPKKKWLQQENWSNNKIEEFERLRKDNKLMLVKLQTDYYKPSHVVMYRDMPITIFRNF